MRYQLRAFGTYLRSWLPGSCCAGGRLPTVNQGPPAIPPPLAGAGSVSAPQDSRLLSDLKQGIYDSTKALAKFMVVTVTWVAAGFLFSYTLSMPDMMKDMDMQPAMKVTTEVIQMVRPGSTVAHTLWRTGEMFWFVRQYQDNRFSFSSAMLLYPEYETSRIESEAGNRFFRGNLMYFTLQAIPTFINQIVMRHAPRSNEGLYGHAITIVTLAYILSELQKKYMILRDEGTDPEVQRRNQSKNNRIHIGVFGAVGLLALAFYLPSRL